MLWAKAHPPMLSHHSSNWGKPKQAPHKWCQSRFFCLYTHYTYKYIHIYMYICCTSFRIIPVFYFNDLQLLTVHAHVYTLWCYKERRLSYGDTKQRAAKLHSKRSMQSVKLTWLSQPSWPTGVGSHPSGAANGPWCSRSWQSEATPTNFNITCAYT